MSMGDVSRMSGGLLAYPNYRTVHDPEAAAVLSVAEDQLL
jgi:hypothetical protein